MSRSFVFHKPYPVAARNEVFELPKDRVRDPHKSYRARPAALNALSQMCEAAQKEGVGIVVISSYRALDEQTDLFRKGEIRHGKGRAILWLAPPGYSEHHTGYVFDLADRDHPATDDEQAFEQTPAFEWLNRNAARFGFELSFPKGNWQGIGYEPWHWRFIGDEAARKCFHPNILKKSWNLLRCIATGVSCRLK